MSSHKAFLRDYLRFNYSAPEIVERYIEGFSEVKYGSFSMGWFQNEILAVKCAKRGKMFIAGE
jgi:hypothetical protein